MTVEDEKRAATLLNSSELLKSMLAKHNVQKIGQVLPIVLFITGRLYHGRELLDSSNSAVCNLKDTISLDQTEFYFPNWTIDSLPLEVRITLEISAIYNNSYLKKLSFVSFNVFDGFGVLRTGPRVTSF